MDVISYALSKKYTDEKNTEQKVKIAGVEKELNNFKSVINQVNVNQEAKQLASGYGIVSLPKNAANGQVSDVVIKGLTATQMFQNGNVATNRNITDNGMPFFTLKDGQWIHSWIGYADNRQVFDIISGHKYYAKLKIKSSSVGRMADVVDINYSDGTKDRVSSSANNMTTVSKIIVASKTASANVSFAYTRSTELNGLIERDYQIFIDLTQTFGAGNEPTEEECDQIFSNYFDGTKSAIGAIRLKSVGKNLFSGWELGGINFQTGQNSGDTNQLRTKNYIRVDGNTEYNIDDPDKISANASNAQFLYEYDKDKNFLSGTILFSSTFTKQFLTKPNTAYVRFKSQAVGIMGYVLGEYQTFKTQLRKSGSPEEYEPYIESNAYVVAKNKDNKIVNLTTVKDTVGNIVSQDKIITKENGKMECVLENKSMSNVATSTVINYANMKDGGYFNAYGADGENQVGVKGDTLTFAATTLIYQLAEPEIIPVQVSGNIASHPSGTVYIDPATTVAGVYMGGIPVTHTDLPIGTLERITVIDYATGLETELDVSQAVISEDRLLFTHPDLSDGDIVFFEYEYDVESTEGKATIEFYDSRYTIKDSVTGKFYKWEVTVADGVPSIGLVEV